MLLLADTSDTILNFAMTDDFTGKLEIYSVHSLSISSLTDVVATTYCQMFNS